MTPPADAVTAETLTDAQLQRLLVEWGSLAVDIRQALHGDRQARAYCAAAWNARHAPERDER